MNSSRVISYSSLTVKRLRLSLFFLALLIAGCSRTTLVVGGKVPTEATARQVLLAGLDSSASNRQLLPLETGDVATLSLVLDQDTAWMTIWKIDSDVAEIFPGPYPDSDEDLLREITPHLAMLSGRDNTYLQKLLVAMAARAAKCSGRCVIFIATDGFCEGMSVDDHKLMRSAIQSLADNKHVVGVFVEGVNPVNMAAMRTDFSPVASKLQFLPAGKIDSGLVSDLLKAGGAN